MGQERMLLFDINGRSRNRRRLVAVVFQNARANGDALVADVSPRIITGVRNELPNGVLRFAAKRAAEIARGRIILLHLYISNLEDTLRPWPIEVTENTYRAVTRAQICDPLVERMPVCPHSHKVTRKLEDARCITIAPLCFTVGFRPAPPVCAPRSR